MTFYNLPDTDVKIEYTKPAKKGDLNVLRILNVPSGYEVDLPHIGDEDNREEALIVAWGTDRSLAERDKQREVRVTTLPD